MSLSGIGLCKQSCESAPDDLGIDCIALDWEDQPKVCRLYTQFNGTLPDDDFKAVICEEGEMDFLLIFSTFIQL